MVGLLTPARAAGAATARRASPPSAGSARGAAGWPSRGAGGRGPPPRASRVTFLDRLVSVATALSKQTEEYRTAMTVAIDRTTTTPKRVLMVVANPATSTTTGWPVGFWASELFHPLYEFTEAGYEVTVASPEGGPVELDGLSDPRDPSGYSASDVLSLGYLSSDAHSALLKDTPRLPDLDPDEYDAIVVCGGQSPMFT